MVLVCTQAAVVSAKLEEPVLGFRSLASLMIEGIPTIRSVTIVPSKKM